MTDLRSYLRQATAEAHQRLDAILSTYRLDDVDDYATFLALQADVIVPLEKALEDARIERLLPDWPERRRRMALRGDLASLGRATSPQSQIILPATDEATLMGMAYVLEGSRLGARMLLKQVSGRAANATAYLAHGNEARLWQSFLVLLESNTAAQQAPDKLLSGASHVFALFQAAAERASVPAQVS